jgi:ribosome-binding protein aMBF1 (putative translation factor)
MSEQMSETDKLVAVCIGVIRERIGRLPKDDRDELFELVAELPKATTEEESKSVWLAMQEILSQQPMSSTRLPLTERPLTATRSRKWAEHVGKCVKKHRDEKGWTQSELATKAGLPQSHISRIERAEYTPTHKTIGKIAEAFGIELGEIDPSCC